MGLFDCRVVGSCALTGAILALCASFFFLLDGSCIRASELQFSRARLMRGEIEDGSKQRK